MAPAKEREAATVASTEKEIEEAEVKGGRWSGGRRTVDLTEAMGGGDHGDGDWKEAVWMVKKTERDGEEEERQHVGERRPSWVMGEEMRRGGTVERSGGWVEKKQRREGGEAEVDGCGGSEEEGSLIQAGKEEREQREAAARWGHGVGAQ